MGSRIGGTNPFDGCSDQYERFRPDYPAELIDIIDGLGTGPIIDVGAGTGKASAPLVSRRRMVVSVEPSLSMIGSGNHSHRGLRYVCAKAEELPMASASASIVICAQAFHWLDAERALREFARVTRPGGHVCVFWNNRDLSEPAPQVFDQLIHKWNPGHVQGYRGKDWGGLIRATSLFRSVEFRALRQRILMTVDDWIGLSRSISYVQSMGPEKLPGFENELRERLEQLDGMDCPYITELWTAGC